MTTTKSKRTQKSAVAKAIVFDHARTDPSHCLADGLFRPILHGKREESPLDVSYKFKNVLFRWQNPTTALCIKDQGVFLAIHRIAADKSRVTKVGISHSDADQLAARNALDLELEANTHTANHCKTLCRLARLHSAWQKDHFPRQQRANRTSQEWRNLGCESS